MSSSGAAARVLPDIVVSRVAVAPGSVRAGESLRVRDTTRNLGLHPVRASVTAYYLSRNAAKGPGDVRVGSRRVGRLRPRGWSRGLNTIPLSSNVAAGTYHLLACADVRHRIRERREDNNCRASGKTVTVKGAGRDSTPPRFGGLVSVTTCIPPGPGHSSNYTLRWNAASDDMTRQARIFYEVFQTTLHGGEDFEHPTYTTGPGATAYTTPLQPPEATYYFVVRARDEAGNRDANRVERTAQNVC